MKYCGTCKDIKPLASFHRSKKSVDGKVLRCKSCCKAANAASYKKHIESRRAKGIEKYKQNPEAQKEANARYIATYPDRRAVTLSTYTSNNLARHSAYQAKRRALKLQRTPKWSEDSLIKDFYINRPEGYEVDHIVPLKGTNVSGLHVLSNLQYLSICDNRQKSNKYGYIQ